MSGANLCMLLLRTLRWRRKQKKNFLPFSVGIFFNKFNMLKIKKNTTFCFFIFNMFFDSIGPKSPIPPPPSYLNSEGEGPTPPLLTRSPMLSFERCLRTLGFPNPRPDGCLVFHSWYSSAHLFFYNRFEIS